MTIYQRVIRPFVLKHQRQLDSAIDAVSGAAQAFGGEGRHQLTLMLLVLFKIWHLMISKDTFRLHNNKLLICQKDLINWRQGSAVF